VFAAAAYYEWLSWLLWAAFILDRARLRWRLLSTPGASLDLIYQSVALWVTRLALTASAHRDSGFFARSASLMQAVGNVLLPVDSAVGQPADLTVLLAEDGEYRRAY
jgi:hypothetical protein